MATNNAVNTSLSGQTGTGKFVGDTSPTLVTPVLGTPSSGTLTSCTGLPVSTGISGLGTGVATALASNVNGSGAISLTTSPTLVTPVLGASTATSINFGGSTLSVYSDSTSFIPVLQSNAGGTCTYTTQVGTYTQIGSIVNFNLTIIVNVSSLTSGQILIPLPTSANASYGYTYSIFATGLGVGAITQLMAITGIGDSTFMRLQTFAAGSASALTTSNCGSGATIYVSGCYHV